MKVNQLRFGVASALLLQACAGETVFLMSLRGNPVGQPPAPTQEIGSVVVSPGTVTVVSLAGTSNSWAQITRQPGPNAPIPGLGGIFSKVAGDGDYMVTASMFIPDAPAHSAGNVASIEFDGGLAAGPFSRQSFMHIDFRPDGRIRIDDDASTDFGSFPRNQNFLLTVALHIGPASTATISLLGANTSGSQQHVIAGPFNGNAREFGAVTFYMGFPWSGVFDTAAVTVHKS